MARLPLVDVASCGDELRAEFRRIEELRGEVSNLFRLLANSDGALKACFTLSRYVRDESPLPARLREIAILAAAVELDIRYELVAHLVAARQAGLSEAEVGGLVADNEEPFSQPERAIIRYSKQVTRTRDVSEEVVGELLSHYSVAAVVDLAVTVAWYQFVGAIVQPLAVEPDASLTAKLEQEGGGGTGERRGRERSR